MKPAPFEYRAPATLDEAVELVAEHGHDAKLLAGGQSLVPAMNFRLARPAVLVDLNRVVGLSYIESQNDGTPVGRFGRTSIRAGGGAPAEAASAELRIGAMARQAEVERSATVRRRAPLLHAAMPHVAHPQVRNRGTIGGSLAHADPAAELPAVMVALDASMRIRGVAGERRVAAADFFQGLFTTALAADEVLIEIGVPAAGAGNAAGAGGARRGWSFQEVARRQGDFALVGVAAVVGLAGNGRCDRARLVFVNVGDRPIEPAAVSAILIGEEPGEDRLTEAARAASEELEPRADIHASAAFRRHLAAVLGRRALQEAFHRATAGDPQV